MARTRRRFDAGFKAKVGLEALKGLRSVQEIAQQFQVHPNQVSLWKKQLLTGANQVFEDGSSRAAASDEPSTASLNEQIGRLKVDLEWLKKKVTENT
ncbi:MAG: transposase [Pirellulales bacterium]